MEIPERSLKRIGCSVLVVGQSRTVIGVNHFLVLARAEALDPFDESFGDEAIATAGAARSDETASAAVGDGPGGRRVGIGRIDGWIGAGGITDHGFIVFCRGFDARKAVFEAWSIAGKHVVFLVPIGVAWTLDREFSRSSEISSNPRFREWDLFQVGYV